MDDASGLSPGQLQQFRAFLADKFNAWEFAFLTHDSGMMEDHIWQGWDAHYRSLLERPGGLQYWTQGRQGYFASFDEYLGSILGSKEYSAPDPKRSLRILSILANDHLIGVDNCRRGILKNGRR